MAQSPPMNSCEIRNYPTPTAITGSYSPFPRTRFDARRKIRNPDVLSGRTRTAPRGTENPSNLCYRNALFAMLLSNDVFMTYVKRWLEEREQLLGSNDDNDTTPVQSSYRILAEMWSHFWNAGHTDAEYNKQFNECWAQFVAMSPGIMGPPWYDVSTRSQSKGRASNVELYKGHKTQRDAQELLDLIFRVERYAPDDEAYAEAFYQSMADALAIPLSASQLCRKCHAKEPAKRHRARPDDPDSVWRVGLPRDDGSSHRLQDVLHGTFKSAVGAWFCDDCEPTYTKEERIAIGEGGWRGPRWDYVCRLPEIALMQFNRFENWTTYDEGQEGVEAREKSGHDYVEKNNVDVDISSEEIDLAKYFEKGEGAVPESERVNTKYELVGVVSHGGTYEVDESFYWNGKKRIYVTEKRENSGHYICFVKYDGKWYQISDSRVNPSSFEDAVSTATDFKPYILMWQRKLDVPIDEVQRKANEAENSVEAAPVHSSSVRVDDTTKASPPGHDNTSADDAATYLRINVGIDGKDYYLLHHIDQLGPTPIAAKKQLDQAKFKLDTHLVQNLSDGINARELDLVAATNDDSRPAAVQRKRQEPHPCTCGVVHEDACVGLGRKRRLPNDFHGNDSRCDFHGRAIGCQPKPLCAARRQKVLAAMDTAKIGWKTTWKSFQQGPFPVASVTEVNSQAANKPLKSNNQAKRKSAHESAPLGSSRSHQKQNPQDLSVQEQQILSLLDNYDDDDAAGAQISITGQVVRSAPQRPLTKPLRPVAASSDGPSSTGTSSSGRSGSGSSSIQTRNSNVVRNPNGKRGSASSKFKAKLKATALGPYNWIKNDLTRIRHGRFRYRRIAVASAVGFGAAFLLRAASLSASDRTLVARTLAVKKAGWEWWANKNLFDARGWLRDSELPQWQADADAAIRRNVVKLMDIWHEVWINQGMKDAFYGRPIVKRPKGGK